jgi:AraC-like DNA-binding protein
MIKLIISVLTMFSVITTSMMQDYVDRANAIYGQIDPKYANTLSVETRPSVYLQASREVVDSARELAPGFAEDIDTLLNEYEGKLSIDEIKEQYEQFENQAVDSPAFTEAKRYIDDASVYLDETVMTLAVELALEDLSTFTSQWVQEVSTMPETLQQDVLGD